CQARRYLRYSPRWHDADYSQAGRHRNRNQTAVTFRLVYSEEAAVLAAFFLEPAAHSSPILNWECGGQGATAVENFVEDRTGRAADHFISATYGSRSHAKRDLRGSKINGLEAIKIFYEQFIGPT